MEDYKLKYEKYKIKYNKLKEINIKGGGKIFNLQEKYKYKKGELHKNLKEFIEEYGENFKIKYNDIIIEVELKKVKLLNGTEIYQIYTEQKK